jgi:asparagine synthase (glutamine-hydrolysing)
MCGIAGVFSSGFIDNKMKILIEDIIKSQHRRGPDYQAIELIDGIRTNVMLGHNRLSIIDLTTAANQPMWDREGRYCLVYNGEAYNYIELKAELEGLGHFFYTRSDSEVIIEAFKEWGVRCVERLNGMFAFALFDAVEERLYLFRDRFGVKPFYYFFDKDTFIFASTSTVIAEHLKLKPDPGYVARGLRYGIYEGGDIAPFTGLKELRPAHYLEVILSETGKLTATLNEYYRLETRVTSLVDSLERKSIKELVTQVNTLLESAVDIRFRADVPVGVSLSGGLDSSTVAALSALREGEVMGFTFGHPDDLTSEGPLVQKISERSGIKVRYIRPGIKEIINAFYQTIDAQGAPFTAGSVMAQYLVFKAARSERVKVLLGGQGGDEIFMGYRKFLMFYLIQLLSQKRYADAFAFALSLAPTFVAECPQAAIYWKERPRYAGDSGVDAVLNLPPAANENLGFDPAQPLWMRQIHDVLYSSLPTLLRYEDRNSMGNSVESRLPFLDYRLVEVALALPVAVKLRNGFGKWIVREVMKGKIPETIRIARYKRGFDVGQADWIDRGLGTSIRESLQERFSGIKEWLVPDVKIGDSFSDKQLKKRPLAFAEAVTLIWLGNQAR